MANQLVEWVVRAQVISSTVTAGERIVIGDVIDVGDWEELVVEVYTLGGSAPTNFQLQLQTGLSQMAYSGWRDVLKTPSSLGATDSVPVAVRVSLTDGATNALPASSPDPSLPPLKFLRLSFIHNATGLGETAIVHVWLFLKKRVP